MQCGSEACSDSLFKDFSFATEEDLSRAIAALLTPAFIFGQVIKARPPLMVIESDESQTGKGYLVKLIAALYNQKPSIVTQRKGSLGGFEESFNMYLIQGRNLISFDNIRGKLESPSIESFLTEDRYLARIPYMPPVEIDPKRTILFLTSNQAEMTVDLTNRSCCIQIRKQPHTHKFMKYPEGDLRTHIITNHLKYLGAVKAIIEEWVKGGCPQTEESHHSFRKWEGILDWIVQYMFHLPPLMKNHRERQKRIAKPQLTWARSIGLLVMKCGRANQWLRANDIVALIQAAGDGIKIPGLKDGETLREENNTHVLLAIGRDCAICFSGAASRECEEGLVEFIEIDEVTIERKKSHAMREGDSGPYEAKEYRFTKQKGSLLLPSPVSAIVATEPSRIFKESSFIPPENNGTKMFESPMATVADSGDGGGNSPEEYIEVTI